MKESSSEIVEEGFGSLQDKKNKIGDGTVTGSNGQTQLATVFSQQDGVLSGPQIESLKGFDKNGVKITLGKSSVNIGCEDEENLDPSVLNVINKKLTNSSREN